MRITEAYLNRSVSGGLGRLTSDLARLNEQASSGKRVLKPSDDPVAAAGALSLRANLDALKQQQRNGEFWQGWLQASESATSQVSDVVSRARQVAVQMSNATYTADQRASAAQEVNNLLEETVSLANTQHEGRYLFAGLKDNQPAFTTTKDASGQITNVTYAGDSGHQQAKLGANTTMQTSLTGQEIFQGGGDIFSALISLRDALNTNAPTQIGATIDQFQQAGNNVSSATSDIGARLNRLDMRTNIIKDTTVAQTSRLSDLEDADVVETITNLQAKETAYQAALKSAATIQQLNLAAFL